METSARRAGEHEMAGNREEEKISSRGPAINVCGDFLEDSNRWLICDYQANNAGKEKGRSL